MTPVFSVSALSCSGIEDYFATLKVLKSNEQLGPEKREALIKVLMADMAVHDDGCATNNISRWNNGFRYFKL